MTSTPFKQTPITRALTNLNWVPLEYPQNLEVAIFLAFVAIQRNGTCPTRLIEEAVEEKQLIVAAMQLMTNEYAQMQGVGTQRKMMPPPPDPPDVSCSPRLKKKQKLCHFWTVLYPKTHICLSF